MAQPIRAIRRLTTSGPRAIVVVGAVVAIAVGATVDTIPASYRASAVVVAQQASSDASVAKVLGLSGATVDTSERHMPYVLTGERGSTAIAARVSAGLRGVTPAQVQGAVSISDTTDPSTPVGRQYTRAGLHILAVTAVSSSRQESVTIANLFAREYVDYRKSSVLALHNARFSELASQLRATQRDPGGLSRAQGLRDQLTQLDQLASIQENSLQFRVRAILPRRRVGPYVVRDALVAGLIAAFILLLLKLLADSPAATRRAVSARSLGSSS